MHRYFLVVLVSAGAAAQMNTFSITGFVRDPANAVIPGAHVTAVQVSTKLSFTRETNEAGLYVFSQLAPGEYSISVNVEHFRAAVRDGLNGRAGERLRQKRQLVDLLLKGRQFLELALLSEGVMNPLGGTRGDSL